MKPRYTGVEKAIFGIVIAVVVLHFLMVDQFSGKNSYDGLLPGIIFYWIIAPLSAITVTILAIIRYKRSKDPGQQNHGLPADRKSNLLVVIICLVVVVLFGLVGLLGLLDNF